MRRKICMLLSVILCAFAVCPLTAFAKTYHLGDTDMHLRVDDTTWYVFTRDNLENNPELAELGISYDTMHSILYENEAYMDACLIYDDSDYVELFVRKRAIDSGIANLSNYEDKVVLELAEGLAKRQNAEEYSVYESQYKFAKLEYVDSALDYYICEFVTVVNKDNYTLTFQSPTPFTDSEYGEIKRIVDSASFDVDPTIQEEKTSSFWENVLTGTIIGAVCGGIAGAVVALVSKNKKKNRENDGSFPVDPVEPH